MRGTYWLIGASEGLGEALARALHKKGVSLVLSARNGDKLAALAAELPGARVLALDVKDAAAVQRAADMLGDIDGMVWLAGVYWPMSAEALEAAPFLEMCDVNFMGAARAVAAVVPGMVKRGRGHIVLTGSLSAFRGLPGAMGYQASKAGCMALAESLHADLRGTGVRVQLASPGFIKTRLTAKNAFKMPFLMDPETAAAEMVTLMEGQSFARHFPRVFSWLFRGSRFLPDWAYYRVFAPK
ncbi:SDR family NAD(P)-dependent oxidoreductase [Rhodobacter sp. KR11]|uniref:SDR family NAD(P)-dependent oxidoreductase n=1 Tax=Rhodobacter sp. KR11 TaxID=2974588 RepID=UPI002222AEE5|nr:SDR family NAD(P)-dependent oxidoreductase [Rhodobacter sp. KR11]MCW1919641.1 SDR family NAD(P)-dependent oxidoreductase [Rhodobacter sp. KR11]